MSVIVISYAEKNIARIVQSIIQLTQGRVNSTGVVTLRNGQVTTVVSAPNCGKDSQVFFTAKTPQAALIVPAPYVKTADVLLGSFVITHPNPGGTLATFGYDCRG